MKFDDTIIAPATVPGTGAISLLRLSGPQAFSIVDSIVDFVHGSAGEAPGGTVKFGAVRQEDGSILDEVLCSVYRSPHSYTGEDTVEISCHASSYIVSTLLQLAIDRGARMAEPGEFTQRAFLAGKMDLAQAEAVADVIASSTSSAHTLAFRQLKGGVSRELDTLREELLQMTSLLELELDFSEEDVEFADRQRFDELLRKTIVHIESLMDSFRIGNAVKRGVAVAIVGAPNAGKSTLMNAILGERRSIVSDIPGTTRDTVEENFNHDGVLFRLVDTAGIRELGETGAAPLTSSSTLNKPSCRKVSSSDDDAATIERMGIERSIESIKKADIVLVVIDSTSVLEAPDFPDLKCDFKSNLSRILAACVPSQKLIFALNKSDLLENASGNNFVCIKNHIVLFIDNKEFTSKFLQNSSFLSLCAADGRGVSGLLDLMSAYIKSNIKSGESECSVISSARHYEALSKARSCLLEVRSCLSSGTPSDLVAEDLRDAISYLGSITGKISSQEILNNIFSKFCIGK